MKEGGRCYINILIPFSALSQKCLNEEIILKSLCIKLCLCYQIFRKCRERKKNGGKEIKCKLTSEFKIQFKEENLNLWGSGKKNSEEI